MGSHISISPNLVDIFVKRCPYPMVERGDRWICATEDYTIIIYKKTGFIIVTGPEELKKKIKKLCEI